MDNESLSHITRTEELYRLHNLLQEYNRVVVVGEEGIGKSQLVRDYIEFFDSDYQQSFLFLSFPRDDEAVLLATLQTLPNGFPALLVVDHLDRFTADDRERLLRFLKTNRSVPLRVIITGRGTEKEMAPFLSSGISMRLYGLSPAEVKELSLQLRWKSALDEGSVEVYKQLALTYDGHPGKIHALYSSIVIEDELTLTVLGTASTAADQIHYRLDNIPSPLITDIRFVDRKLIDIISRDPDAVYHFSSRKFEELVAEYFEKLGHKVTLTQATRDGGRDLHVLEDKGFGKFLYYVECKRNRASRPVGVTVIRELHGVVNHERATAGIVVTSSHFSQDAKEFQQKIPHQMNLIDYERFRKLINSLPM